MQAAQLVAVVLAGGGCALSWLVWIALNHQEAGLGSQQRPLPGTKILLTCLWR